MTWLAMYRSGLYLTHAWSNRYKQMIVNVGLIILFAIALHLEQRNLNVFGITPVAKRMLQFLLGMLLTTILSTTINVSFSRVADFAWRLNHDYTKQEMLNRAYSTINSVLFEELIFRAYLFYKLFQYLGEKRAVLISSAMFGVYHWFTFGVLGNYPMMVWTFFYTGLWGAMFAIAYTRTGTILFAIGLHWGWNFLDQSVFNRNGQGFLEPVTTERTIYLGDMIGSLITVLPTILFAVVVTMYLVKRRTVQIKV